MLDGTTGVGGSTTPWENRQTEAQTLICPAVQDALNLLSLWGLPELHTVFREQEISTRSLKYLTNDEIVELIPKVGPRTIFRALLNEWRQHGQVQDSTQFSAIVGSEGSKRNFESAFLPTSLNVGHQLIPATICKTEVIEANDWEKSKTPSLVEGSDPNDSNECVLGSIDQPCDITARQFLAVEENMEQRHSKRVPDTTREARYYKKLDKLYYTEYNGEGLSVYDLLINSCDGQYALTYYKHHKHLDLKSRKRVVNVLTHAVLERRIHKYTATFMDMTNQLMKLFPNEKYETFFVPHRGHESARGALFYKYSNLTRQLRRDGLLEYKKTKHAG